MGYYIKHWQRNILRVYFSNASDNTLVDFFEMSAQDELFWDVSQIQAKSGYSDTLEITYHPGLEQQVIAWIERFCEEHGIPRDPVSEKKSVD